MLARWLKVSVAASAFAGWLGAGVVDLGLIMIRGQEVPAVQTAALVLGLYGVVGLVLGGLLGWTVAVVSAALQDAGASRDRPDLDARLAAGVLLGAFGALVVGSLAAVARVLFVSRMHSQSLATIATFGVTLLAVLPAMVLALALRRPALRLVAVLPCPAGLDRFRVALLLLGLLGLAAGVLAFSQADWRVLDLGPLQSAGIALLLGVAHFLFWYRRPPRASGRVRLTVRLAVVVAVLVLAVVGSRVPETSSAFAAVQDQSLGMRLHLATARRLTDRDGDGFSTRFGGGDCDDRRKEVFPGAEDLPGDGLDQNCEGGDAKGSPGAAGGSDPPPAQQPIRRRGEGFSGNILIVSIDALRADRLGVAGYRKRQNRSLTPNLDALANQGAYFRRVWSQAPNTPRSFPSMLTSRLPSEVTWVQRSLNYSPIAPANETFFEQLAGAGLRPIGLFSHFYFSADRGLNQGFAEWNNDGAGTIAESNKDIASPRIVPRVIDRLKKAAAAKERFVLWTHLFEPHSSYMNHPEYPTTLRGVPGLEEKYDFEIAYVDGWFGKIIAALEELGLRQNTAVVVFADHGEAWGEHKFLFHGQDLTEEQLRVPLIVAVPGKKPAVINDPVALMDVGATLVDLVGLEPPPSFRGRSLLPAIEGQPLSPRPIYAELLPATAWPKHETMMVDGSFKINHKITDRRWELFDLAKDPGQQTDLARDPAHRARLEELRKKLLSFEESRPAAGAETRAGN
jgi:arylsulfatase A-like enzyme